VPNVVGDGALASPGWAGKCGLSRHRLHRSYVLLGEFEKKPLASRIFYLRAADDQLGDRDGRRSRRLGLNTCRTWHIRFDEGHQLAFMRIMPDGERPSDNLMTVKETAEYLGIPLPTVYYLVQRGQLPAIQIGGRWRVKKDALDRNVLRTEEQGQPTVLVVDDDEGLQAMFKLFLKKAGLSRVVVGTGKDALLALSKQKFDLCFLDLQLPDLTGDQIYSIAKDKYPDLPIVIITGYPDSAMLDNILRFGPVTVLKKPLRVDDLEKALRMLGHKSSKPQAA